MDAVAGVAEVIAWVGLSAAVPFALLAVFVRLVRGPWRTATAEVVDSEVRWFGERGDLHSAVAPDGVEGKEDFEIFYRAGKPADYHVERVAHDEKTYRFLAILLAAIAALAAVVSAVASLGRSARTRRARRSAAAV